MDRTSAAIEAVVNKELIEANKKYPHFSSLHEGYGVILEEVEETEAELQEVRKYLGYAWQMIKDNNTKLAISHVCRLKSAAKALMAEACQVAAMAQKILDSETAREPMRLHTEHPEKAATHDGR